MYGTGWTISLSYILNTHFIHLLSTHLKLRPETVLQLTYQTLPDQTQTLSLIPRHELSQSCQKPSLNSPRDFAHSHHTGPNLWEFGILTNHRAGTINRGITLDTKYSDKYCLILLKYAIAMMIFMYVIIGNPFKNRYVYSELIHNSSFSSCAGRLRTAWSGHKHGTPVMAATWGV